MNERQRTLIRLYVRVVPGGRGQRWMGVGWGAKYHLQGQSRIGHPPSSGASRPSSPLGPPRLRLATPPAHPSTRRDVVRREKEEGGGLGEGGRLKKEEVD